MTQDEERREIEWLRQGLRAEAQDSGLSLQEAMEQEERREVEHLTEGVWDIVQHIILSRPDLSLDLETERMVLALERRIGAAIRTSRLRGEAARA